MASNGIAQSLIFLHFSCTFPAQLRKQLKMNRAGEGNRTLVTGIVVYSGLQYRVSLAKTLDLVYDYLHLLWLIYIAKPARLFGMSFISTPTRRRFIVPPAFVPTIRTTPPRPK